jgi:hypothetical protein
LELTELAEFFAVSEENNLTRRGAATTCVFYRLLKMGNLGNPVTCPSRGGYAKNLFETVSTTCCKHAAD